MSQIVSVTVISHSEDIVGTLARAFSLGGVWGAHLTVCYTKPYCVGVRWQRHRSRLLSDFHDMERCTSKIFYLSIQFSTHQCLLSQKNTKKKTIFLLLQKTGFKERDSTSSLMHCPGCQIDYF